MGNCWRNTFRRRRICMQINIVILGLDNAGKTTAMKNLTSDTNIDTVSTIGYSPITLYDKGHKITIYDLGGGVKFRQFWKQYFSSVHGIIFVIDANDKHRIVEAKEELTTVLNDSRITGKPILILGNQKEYTESLNDIDIINELCLEQLVNKVQSPARFELSNIRPVIYGRFKKKHVDRAFIHGYRWLLRQITNNYKLLNERVERELSEYMKEQNEIREQRRKGFTLFNNETRNSYKYNLENTLEEYNINGKLFPQVNSAVSSSTSSSSQQSSSAKTFLLEHFKRKSLKQKKRIKLKRNHIDILENYERPMTVNVISSERSRSAPSQSFDRSRSSPFPVKYCWENTNLNHFNKEY